MIGRPSIFGNPYSHMENTQALFRVANRDEAVDKYRHYFLTSLNNDENFAKEVQALKLKCSKGDVNLVCFCVPLRCHGHVLKEYLEDNS